MAKQNSFSAQIFEWKDNNKPSSPKSSIEGKVLPVSFSERDANRKNSEAYKKILKEADALDW